MGTFPESLCGKNTSSFAFVTIRDRMPEILTKVVDVFSRRASKMHGENREAVVGKTVIKRLLKKQDEAEDCKQIVGKLSKLKNEMQTDKELLKLKDSYPDVEMWNEFIGSLKSLVPEKPPSWYTVPWLFCECYLYRRIFEALQLSEFHKSFDPFAEQKEEALASSDQSRKTLASYVMQFVNPSEAPSEETDNCRTQLRLDFEMLLEYCLWGNKCDLSLSGGSQVAHQLEGSSQLKNLLEHILANDTEKIWNQIMVAESRAAGHARLDFVLDNAGFEIFTDLCLAEFLLDKKLFDFVYFHVKDTPWFVSDASRKDFTWTIDQCKESNDVILRQLALRWEKRVEDGTFVVKRHPFWTYPSDYASMKAISPELYQCLSDSQLVIFKGDLNYRKLTGDLSWDHTTPFSVALRGFAPAPLCALRTLKADLVVGLAEGKDRETKEKEEDWMVNGKYAVIQYCGGL